MSMDKMRWDLKRYTWVGGRDLDVASTTTTGLIGGGTSGYVTGMYGKIVTAFTGILGPVYAEIGTSDDSNCMMLRADLAQTGYLFIHLLEDLWFCNKGTKRDSRNDLESPIITFTSLSGNLEDLTAGWIEIVKVILVPDVR